MLPLPPCDLSFQDLVRVYLTRGYELGPAEEAARLFLDVAGNVCMEIEMSQHKKEIRRNFRDSVFRRDNNRCVTCGATGCVLDAHHITDRNEMPNGGYVIENGISLCGPCHIKAEAYHGLGVAEVGFEPEALYGLIGSSYELAVKMSGLL